MHDDVDQQLRKSVYQMLADNPDIEIYPTAEVWQDQHPIPEFRKLHSQINWEISSDVGISVTCACNGSWENLYLYITALVAATKAYRLAEAGIEQMIAQGEQKEGQA
jgi:hypothetical protein